MVQRALPLRAYNLFLGGQTLARILWQNIKKPMRHFFLGSLTLAAELAAIHGPPGVREQCSGGIVTSPSISGE